MGVHVIADGAGRDAAARRARALAPMRRALLLMLFLLAVSLSGAADAGAQGPRLDRVKVNERSLRAGGEPFVAYGFNYGFGDDEGTLAYFDHPDRAGLG